MLIAVGNEKFAWMDWQITPLERRNQRLNAGKNREFSRLNGDGGSWEFVGETASLLAGHVGIDLHPAFLVEYLHQRCTHNALKLYTIGDGQD